MKKTLITLLGWLAFTICSLFAETPDSINYQGILTDSNGDLVDGTVSVTVRLYNDPIAGILLYEELIGNVTVTNGVYSFTFGAAGTGASDGEEIFDALSGPTDYLAIVIDGDESTPRTQLLAVPYAMKSRESDDAQALLRRVELIEARLDSAGIPPVGMVRVGTGTMDRLPVTYSLDPVVVTEPFYIGIHEVTTDEFNLVKGWAIEHGYEFKAHHGLGCAGDHPVHTLDFDDMVKWLNARSEMEGLTPVYYLDGEIFRTGYSLTTDHDPDANGYRFPTEHEWEFAARGGTLTNGHPYGGSEDILPVGWTAQNSGGADCDYGGTDDQGTWPVGQKLPNELGLYDMLGNVEEVAYPSTMGDAGARRGGSFSSSYAAFPDDAVSHAAGGRVAFPGYASTLIGMRLARNAE